MKRQQALKILSANRDQLNHFSVKDIYILGSVARNESIEGSDVDILVEFQADAKIGLFQFARLQRFLSELLECDVDLATPDALHKDLKDNSNAFITSKFDCQIANALPGSSAADTRNKHEKSANECQNGCLILSGKLSGHISKLSQ